MYKSKAGLCSTCMATRNISAARENLPEAVELAQTEAVFLERCGRSAAVLISSEQYQKLAAALDDAEDVAAFNAAMDEKARTPPGTRSRSTSAGRERVPDRAAAGRPSGPCARSTRRPVVAFKAPSRCWPRTRVRRPHARCRDAPVCGFGSAITASSTPSPTMFSSSSSWRSGTAARCTTGDVAIPGGTTPAKSSERPDVTVSARHPPALPLALRSGRKQPSP